jgi:hypothetical protein
MPSVFCTATTTERGLRRLPSRGEVRTALATSATQCGLLQNDSE